MILAITGATGFVGGRLLERAIEAGHRVRALTRRVQPARRGVEWIAGSLADRASLAELTRGAEAVIHVAGVVNAADRGAFAEGNIAGTEALVEESGGARLVLVSSLAAREPDLSDYGWSKARGEAAVRGSRSDWTIVRPPAVYGPGDHELLDVFRMAKLGIALLPPPGMMSAIHVDDLADLLLALAGVSGDGAVYEPEGPDGGMTHAAFAQAIGAAMGRRVLPLPLPRGLLTLAARADRGVRGARAKLTADRVAYMCHPDWTARADHRPPDTLWTPRIALSRGLAETAQWYRGQGLL